MAFERHAVISLFAPKTLCGISTRRSMAKSVLWSNVTCKECMKHQPPDKPPKPEIIIAAENLVQCVQNLGRVVDGDLCFCSHDPVIGWGHQPYCHNLRGAFEEMRDCLKGREVDEIFERMNS